jgi:hypothetical protein
MNAFHDTEAPSSSRRNWLASMATMAGGLMLLGGSKSPDAFAGGGTPVRRNIGNPLVDQGYARAYRDAVGILRSRSARDPLAPTGWDALAIQHALYCSSVSAQLQVHWGWDFLTWHRGNMWMLERLMRDAIKEPQFAMPYWDASQHPRIPMLYWGDGNPLLDKSRLQEAGDRIPDDLLDIAGPMTLSKFFAFGGYPYDNASGDMVEGSLEGGFHNNVHNWIGGNMGMFATAGFDPLFSAHHNNIDRAWEAWRSQRGEHAEPRQSVWLDRKYQFINEKGRLEDVRVRDMLDIRQLGYAFDNLQFGRRQLPDPVLDADQAVLIPTTGAAASGARLGKVLQFERSSVPIHPFCCRVFLQPRAARPDPATAVYVGTFTVLPVQRGGAKALDHGVTMQLALSDAVRARLRSFDNLDLVLCGVPLKGRDIPQRPVRPPRVRIVDELM